MRRTSRLFPVDVSVGAPVICRLNLETLDHGSSQAGFLTSAPLHAYAFFSLPTFTCLRIFISSISTFDTLFPLVLLFFLPNTTTHQFMPLSIDLTLFFLLLSLSAAF